MECEVVIVAVGYFNRGYRMPSFIILQIWSTSKGKPTQDETRQDKKQDTKQDKKQDKTRQDKTRQDKTRHKRAENSE